MSVSSTSAAEAAFESEQFTAALKALRHPKARAKSEAEGKNPS
jgi:hypothetical protein